MNKETIRCALALAVGVVLVGCGGKTEELAFTQAPLRSISDCPDANDFAISKVCVVDDQGHFYSPFVANPAAPDGMLIAPGGRKLGIVYVFKDAYTPNAADVGASTARTYAAPLDVWGGSTQSLGADAAAGGPATNGTASASTGECCSEDKEANRVGSHSALQGNTLTVSLDDIPGNGLQVAALLDFATLYAHRLAPTCDLPGDMCTYANSEGFAVRFYVDHRP